MRSLALLVMILIMGDQRILKVEEFVLKWEHFGESVRFTLSAPTNGWVALGFSEDNDIINSNLIMLRVDGDEVYAEDQYVIGFGKHPSIESLGSISRISNVEGIEQSGETIVSFSILKQKLDAYHFNLSTGREINVWLAYSVSDDFDHHSRNRILRKIKL